MRVPYTSRRKRSIKQQQQQQQQQRAVPLVKELPTPIQEKKEDDFDFYPMDDEDDDHHHLLEDGQSQQSTSSSRNLQPIVEQPTDADLAVIILEEFFFGGSTQKQPMDDPLSLSSSCTSLTASPTSTLMHPVCSCPHITMGHSHYSTDSLTLSSSPRAPKRPALKQRPRSNSDLGSSKRNVSFTEIRVREYDVELSDHPSCSYGPPIQLGWDYQETQKTSVEDYEVTRSPHRREIHELVLSYNTRRRRLKQSGYGKSDIQRAQQEVERIKRERLITEFFLPAMAIDETLEKVAEKVKGWFRPSRPEPSIVCQIHSPQIQYETD